MKTINKTYYILLTFALSVFLAFTSLPYFTFTSIVYPSLDIYMNYSEVQKIMLWFFPITALIMAITTLNKRKTMEDVFINAGVPMGLLLYMRVSQFFPKVAIVLIVIALITFRIKAYPMYKKWSFLDKGFAFDHAYYEFRRWVVVLFLIVLSPMVVFANQQQIERQESIQLITDDLFKDELIISEFVLYPDTTIENMEEVEILNYLYDFIMHQSRTLGVDSPSLNLVQNTANDQLASYSPEEDEITVDICFVHNKPIKEVLFAISHEVYHKAQYLTLEFMAELEENKINFEGLLYTEELSQLKEAFLQYNINLSNYEDYNKNKLEVDANKFAEEQISKLHIPNEEDLV